MISVRGLLVTLGVGAGLLPSVLRSFVTSHSGVSLVLLGSIAVICIVAATAVIHQRRVPSMFGRYAPWLACGALLGACFLCPLRIGPYVFVASASFGLAGVVSGIGRLRGALARAGTVLAALVVSFACLWPFTFGLHRPIAPERYLALDLRVHTFLEDVPLHDVWAVHLPEGGIGRVLLDVNEAMGGGVTGDETVALAVAVTTYMIAARVFGLAREECFDTLSWVRQRVTDADRERSVLQTGELGFVYYFEREALLEIQTCSVRALYAFALEPEESGYTLYWGVYADHVSWVTPYYMRIIDPVRHLIVFPSFLQRLELRWRARWRVNREPSEEAAQTGSNLAFESNGGWA